MWGQPVFKSWFFFCRSFLKTEFYCVYLSYTTQWYRMHIDTKKVTIAKQIIHHFTVDPSFFFGGGRAVKISFSMNLNNFTTYNPHVCLSSLDSFILCICYFVSSCLYFYISFHQPQTLVTTVLFSLSIYIWILKIFHI